MVQCSERADRRQNRVEQCIEVEQIVVRTVNELYQTPVPKKLEKIAEETLDVPVQQLVALATKDLSDFLYKQKFWLADLERFAMHGKRHEDKTQLVTLMRRFQKAAASSSARVAKRP